MEKKRKNEESVNKFMRFHVKLITKIKSFFSVENQSNIRTDIKGNRLNSE